jgi:predicted methyltransferase
MKKVEISILRRVSKSAKSFWDLLNSNIYPLTDFIQALKDLYNSHAIVIEGDSIRLTEIGKKSAQKAGDGYLAEKCDKCEGKSFILKKEFFSLLEEFRKITKDRPEPVLDYFQGYMRDMDVFVRVALMDYFEDLHRRDIIIIGDDDMLSIALALTDAPNRILVLDADERIGNFITKKSNEYGLDIEFMQYNVSEPLPKNLSFSFDVFSSEPLESVSGLRAFLTRGINSLKKGGSGYFGLTTIEASAKKWFYVEKVLVGMNCLVTDIIRDFSIYPLKYKTVNYEAFVEHLPFSVPDNKSVNWYKSALVRFETLKQSNLSVFDKRLHVKMVDMREDVTYPFFHKRNK